jgi:hypothetical protein
VGSGVVTTPPTDVLLVLELVDVVGGAVGVVVVPVPLGVGVGPPHRISSCEWYYPPLPCRHTCWEPWCSWETSCPEPEAGTVVDELDGGDSIARGDRAA